MSRLAAWFLILLTARACPADIVPAPPKTEGVHAILVVDVATGPAGAAMNEMWMLTLIEEMRRMGIQVGVTKLAAGQITPGNIVAAIRQLDAARLKDRTLLFYFAGHGGTDARTGHFLRTASGDLSRSTLLAEIRAKSPALAVVLTDCCSTSATRKGPAPPVPVPPERRAIENLFLQHRGVVDINASSCRPEQGVYQAAFYHPAMGGLFTYAFTSMLGEVDPFWDREPDDAAERNWPGSKEAHQYRRRFNERKLCLAENDKDGFVEWSEAVDHLGGVLLDIYGNYRSEVRSGLLKVEANARDVETLLSQVSQDPQVFGPLAVRSDRPVVARAAQAVPDPPARLGILFENRYEKGGAFVLITGIETGSPATRITRWREGRRVPKSTALAVGDTILRANNDRVRSREHLFRILDTIPTGGELNLSGTEAKSGKEYKATVILDQYGERKRLDEATRTPRP